MLDNQTGLVRYTPDDNFTGPDNFTYQVADNYSAISNEGVVFIDVTESGSTQASFTSICERPVVNSSYSPHFRYSFHNSNGISSLQIQAQLTNQYKRHATHEITLTDTNGWTLGPHTYSISTGGNSLYDLQWSDNVGKPNANIEYRFIDNNSVAGTNWSSTSSRVDYSSQYFDNNSIWTISFVVKDINSNIMGSFSDNISFGVSSSPEPPLEAWIEPGNDNVTLNWCGVPGVNDYVVSYWDVTGTNVQSSIDSTMITKL